MSEHLPDREVYADAIRKGDDPSAVLAVFEGTLRAALTSRRAEETVSTVEELDALPQGTVIIDRDEDVWQYGDGVWRSHAQAPFRSERVWRYGPLRVLFRPVPAEGSAT